jgi:hypothetical protein
MSTMTATTVALSGPPRVTASVDEAPGDRGRIVGRRRSPAAPWSEIRRVTPSVQNMNRSPAMSGMSARSTSGAIAWPMQRVSAPRWDSL